LTTNSNAYSYTVNVRKSQPRAKSRWQNWTHKETSPVLSAALFLWVRVSTQSRKSPAITY
jgi:hypothetical protein